MSTPDQNKARLAEAYAAWDRSKGDDTDAWMALVDEDVCFSSLSGGRPGIAFAHECRGREEMIGFFRGLTETLAMDRFDVTEFVAEGDRVVAIGTCSWTARATGRSFTTPYALVASFRDGLIVEAREFYDTAMVAGAVG